MKYLILTLLILFASAEYTEEITEGAGMALHIQQSFFDNLKVNLLDEYIKAIETGRFRDINWSHTLEVAGQKLFTIFLDLTNMELHEFELDTRTSFLKLNRNEPNLELFISNFTTKATLDFHFGTDQAFIDDQGDGNFYVGPTSIYLGYGIEVVEGRNTFVTKTAKINSTDFSVFLNGTADFSRVITQVFGLIEDEIMSNVNNHILGVVESVITPLINSAVSSQYNLTYPVGPNVVIDLSSTVAPAFTDEHMTLFFAAGGRPNNTNQFPFTDKMRVPSLLNDGGRQLQVVISDFIFNSTLYSLYQTGDLKIDTKNVNGASYPVPASNFFVIFPTLVERYGAEDGIFFRVTVQETVNPPYVYFENGYINAYLDAEIEMYTQKESLLKLHVDSFLELDAYILRGFLLTLDLRQFRISVRNIVLNNIDPDRDERDIAAFFGLFSGLLRNYVNQFVKSYQVRLPAGSGVDLDDISLDTQDFFVYADVTPVFI